ncbi:MAG: discoidin domain-containing protein, partial [bacterium]|nr:discoidin domain-containing protein [bacterium]
TEFDTPEGFVGSTAYRYTTGDWAVTVNRPVVAPDATVYRVVMVNGVTGFQWEGMVDKVGQVTETLAPAITNEPTPVQSWTEPVEDWRGEIVANPPGLQFDDYFQWQIVDGNQYGIESLDPNIQAQIVALRDTGATVHVWGTLHYNVLDYNAMQIQVTRIEVQEPAEVVAGWGGVIGQLTPGSQFKDYFERYDGQRYDIEGATDALREQIAGYQWTGERVLVWGQLRTDVPAYEGRLIQVEHIGPAVGEPVQFRDMIPLATSSASSHLPTDQGGQYQSWMAMDGALETAWVEGAAGSGIGEWIQFDFSGIVEVSHINLDVGYDRDADIFDANNRIKRVILSFSTGEQIEMELDDARGMQTIVLARAPIPLQTTFVRIAIAEAYPGSRHHDTCLAETEVWGGA